MTKDDKLETYIRAVLAICNKDMPQSDMVARIRSECRLALRMAEKKKGKQ